VAALGAPRLASGDRHYSRLQWRKHRVRRSTLVRIFLIGGALAAVAAPKLWPNALERWWRSPPAAAGAAPSATRRVEAATRVAVETVEPRAFTELVSSTGTLLATESVELQAEVNGKITAINFIEGTRVRKGALLVKLNDADLQARRAAAAHQVALAERRERRVAELLAQGFVIPDDHDQSLNDVNVRRAELELTNAQIAETEIRAPFDGIAGLRYVSEGAFVNAATKIATLQRIDTLKVDFAVPEKYLDRVRVGAPITFTIAGRAERFTGEVYAYDPRIDAETRTLLLRALCPNPGEVLLPGSFASVELALGETEQALLIPAEAVIPAFEAAFVYVVVDGRARQREIRTGVRTATRVQVLAGLAPGDTVITSGLPQLRDGSPVLVEAPGPAIAHR
jgi:membrane fusion protein (multidrug efflux system)